MDNTRALKALELLTNETKYTSRAVLSWAMDAPGTAVTLEVAEHLVTIERAIAALTEYVDNL